MKHGPIALLDKKVPVISIASPGEVFDKVISNAQEAKARDSYLIGIAPECNGTQIFDYLMKVPSSNEWISPLINIVPLQLLSYHIAAHRGLDVDQPRNLAKSVTVRMISFLQIFLIYNSRSPFGGLIIKKFFSISTNGTISLTNGMRTSFDFQLVQ